MSLAVPTDTNIDQHSKIWKNRHHPHISYDWNTPTIYSRELENLWQEYLTALSIVLVLLPSENIKCVWSLPTYLHHIMWNFGELFQSIWSDTIPNDIDITCSIDENKYKLFKEGLKNYEAHGVCTVGIKDNSDLNQLPRANKIDSARKVTIVIWIGDKKIEIDLHISDSESGIYWLTNTKTVNIEFNEKKYPLNISDIQSSIANYLAITLVLLQESIHNPQPWIWEMLKKRLFTMKKLLKMLPKNKWKKTRPIMEEIQTRLFQILSCEITIGEVARFNQILRTLKKQDQDIWINPYRDLLKIIHELLGCHDIFEAWKNTDHKIAHREVQNSLKWILTQLLREEKSVLHHKP